MSDTEAHEHIVLLIQEKDKKNDLQIVGLHKELEAGFDTLAKEIRKISETNKKQEEEIRKLKKVTTANKYIMENPGKAVFWGTVIGLGINEIFSNFTFVELIKMIKIW